MGFPSVGKSTLLTKLTGTFSLAAGYEFTTLTAIPGTMHYRGAKIQVLDLPGIIEGAKDGKGRGRQVLAAALTCNVILIVLDAAKPMTHKLLIEKELYGFGIRLNQEPPDIIFKKKEKGPINFQAMVPQTVLTQEIVARICREYKINSADVFARQDATIDELIDVIEDNRTYIPAIYVLNKIDQLTIEELDIVDQMPTMCPFPHIKGGTSRNSWREFGTTQKCCVYTRNRRASHLITRLQWFSTTRDQVSKIFVCVCISSCCRNSNMRGYGVVA